MPEPIRFETEDGFVLAADWHRPTSAPVGVVITAHAMMVDRRTMDRPRGAGLASVLCDAGFAVLNVDFRGHGESVRPRDPHYSFDDIVRYDVPAIVRAAKALDPTLPTFLVGHSLGVNAGLPGLARMGQHGIAGVVAFAPNLWAPKYDPSPLRRARKAAMVASFDLLSRPTGFFDPAPLGMGRSKIPRAYVAQFSRWFREDRLTSADGADAYEALLAQLTMPILAVSGAADALMAHPEAVERYLANFTGAHVVHRRYVGPGGYEPDHMGLVIDPRMRPMFDEAARFLRGLAEGAR